MENIENGVILVIELLKSRESSLKYVDAIIELHVPAEHQKAFKEIFNLKNIELQKEAGKYLEPFGNPFEDKTSGYKDTAGNIYTYKKVKGGFDIFKNNVKMKCGAKTRADIVQAIMFQEGHGEVK